MDLSIIDDIIQELETRQAYLSVLHKMAVIEELCSSMNKDLEYLETHAKDDTLEWFVASLLENTWEAQRYIAKTVRPTSPNKEVKK
tara:strand:+ start:743 stop:1000 length:258 start_codon:yes stop_codon:yes gene_type:complete